MLASASPARLRLLRAAGFDPEVIISHAPEDGVDHLTPSDATVAVAERKAAAVVPRAGVEGSLVLACDSLLELDGRALGKPRTADVARQRWRAMRGRTGVLHTGHCLVDTAAGWSQVSAVASTVVRFGMPTDTELDAYIASGEPLEVAGAFTLDGRGAPFVDGIDGDPGTVIGVSLPLVRRLLADLDVSITSLWR